MFENNQLSSKQLALLAYSISLFLSIMH